MVVNRSVKNKSGGAESGGKQLDRAAAVVRGRYCPLRTASGERTRASMWLAAAARSAGMGSEKSCGSLTCDGKCADVPVGEAIDDALVSSLVVLYGSELELQASGPWPARGRRSAGGRWYRARGCRRRPGLPASRRCSGFGDALRPLSVKPTMVPSAVGAGDGLVGGRWWSCRCSRRDSRPRRRGGASARVTASSNSARWRRQ